MTLIIFVFVLLFFSVFVFVDGLGLFLCLFLLCSYIFLSFLMTKLTWDNIWGYEKGDPRHDDKKTGGEVIRDDVGHHVPLKSLQQLIFNYSLSLILL